MLLWLVAVAAQDSTSWHKNGEPSKDCFWVSRWEPRCTVKGQSGVLANEVCHDACGAPTAARTSADYVKFPYGVKAGQPTDTTMVLWTKIKPTAPTADCIQLYVQVSETMTDDIDDPDAVIEGSYADNVAWACENTLWSAKLMVSGLAPATRYYYRFKAYVYDYEVSADASSRPPINSWLAPATSRIGTFKTLPAPFAPTESYKIGVLGCSDLSKLPFNSWYQLSKEDELDLVIHTGDYLYADGQTFDQPNAQLPMMLAGSFFGYPHRYPGTVEEFTSKYDRMMLDPDAQELHRKAAWVFNIGDHEIINNYDTNSLSTDYDNYLQAGGQLSFSELANNAVEAWFLNLPLIKDTTELGFWKTEKDVGLPVGDLLYLHVIDDYSQAEPIYIEEVQGLEVVLVDSLLPTMPALVYDSEGALLNEADARAALIELDTRYLETRKVSTDQVARVRDAYAAYANTTWKVTSTGVPQTVAHTTIISQGDVGDGSIAAWPYGFQGISLVDMERYAQIERDLYAEGLVKYPFIAVYQNEGDVSRRELQDIFCDYANNVNFYGDYHTSIQSQHFHYRDLINITSTSPHPYANGTYVDANGDTIYPMLTSIKAGVQSHQFAPGGSNGPARGAEVDVARGWASDVTKYNTPGTIQVDGYVDSARSCLVATFTHDKLHLEWIDGRGYEDAPEEVSTQGMLNFNQFLSNPNAYEAATFGTFVPIPYYDEQSETIVHPWWERVDVRATASIYEVAAVTEPCTTPYVTMVLPVHEGVTGLPSDYPFSLCNYTTTPCAN